MSGLSDKELLNELRVRFTKNKTMLFEQQILTEELKKVNQRLVHAEKLKSNFLSNIRNEINNPLAASLELAKGISGGNMSEEQMIKFGSLLYNEIFNLDFQLRNIFISAELEAGDIVVSGSRVQVDSLIISALNSFKHLLEKKHLKVSIDCKSTDNWLFSDAEKLNAIIINLLSNAIQFSPDNKRIDITYKICDRKLELTINDEGCGISDDHKDLIFDRFKQIEEGTTKSYGGHGLGLSIIKSLTDLFDGSIEFTSELNKGSSFTVIVSEMEKDSEANDVFSSEGNDFFFNDSL